MLVLLEFFAPNWLLDVQRICCQPVGSLGCLCGLFTPLSTVLGSAADSSAGTCTSHLPVLR